MGADKLFYLNNNTLMYIVPLRIIFFRFCFNLLIIFVNALDFIEKKSVHFYQILFDAFLSLIFR